MLFQTVHLCTPTPSRRPASDRHTLGCMQDSELKGQRWKVTQWCLRPRALPGTLQSRCGPYDSSKVARAFKVVSEVEMS